MGSFSSKMRSSTSDNNETGRRETNSDAKQSGIAEGANSLARTDATCEGKPKAGSTKEEPPSEARVARQSFGWLVETPVVLHPTAKELKDNYIKQNHRQPGREKATRAVLWHTAMSNICNRPSLRPRPKRKQSKEASNTNFHGSPSTSSSHGKCTVDKRPNQTHSDQKNINEKVSAIPSPEDAYPAGFGVIRDSVAKDWQKESDDSVRE